jgi:hypothetical protein
LPRDTCGLQAGCRLVKPINPWPLIAMLLLVVFLYLWLNGYLI